jgi:hypothetical protein
MLVNTEIINTNQAIVEYLPESQTIICQLKTEFINRQTFIELFGKMGDFIKNNPVKKFIFDKRSMKVFDQSSMDWYHVIWKPEMKKLGLKTYRKILPNDIIFKKSVELGRQKIAKDNPHFNFNDFDIQYCESIDEALKD